MLRIGEYIEVLNYPKSDRFSDGLQGQGGPYGVSNLVVAFDLDLNVSCGVNGKARIGDVWEFWPFKVLLTKARLSDVTEFHRKPQILMIWKGISKFAQWFRGPKLVLYK